MGTLKRHIGLGLVALLAVGATACGPKLKDGTWEHQKGDDSWVWYGVTPGTNEDGVETFDAYIIKQDGKKKRGLRGCYSATGLWADRVIDEMFFTEYKKESFWGKKACDENNWTALEQGSARDKAGVEEIEYILGKIDKKRKK